MLKINIPEYELRRRYEDERMSQREIANYYGISLPTIITRMKEYEIKSRKNIPKIPEEDLRRMYEYEMLSQREIANYYGIERTTIQRRMKRYGIKARTGSKAIRKFSINEDFFKMWTPESAWLFGWAIGDGCYTDGLRLQFSLSRIDKEVMYKFKEVLESKHPVKDYVSNKGYANNAEMSYIGFNSKTIAKDLNNLTYCDVPREYFNHFLRGFFESDGYVSWSEREKLRRGGEIYTGFSQNDYGILDYIFNVLKTEGIVKGGGIYKDIRKKAWVLRFYMYDSFSLYDYMYTTNCKHICLKRKEEKFEELINRLEVN